MTKTFDDLLADYGTDFDAIKESGSLSKWEVSAIENGDFGRLRLSTAVKIAKAVFTTDEEVNNSLGEILCVFGNMARMKRNGEPEDN